MVLANIASPEFLGILVLGVLLLFGAGQLPKLARSVGEASREFKKSQQEAEQEAAKAKAASAAAAPSPAAITPPSADDKITLSKAELDALLAEREARARRESQTPPSA